MITKNFKKRILLSLCALSLMSFSHSAQAQDTAQGTAKASAKDMKKNMKSASEQVNDSVKVLQKMEADSGLKQALQQARGLFIVPKYGRAGLGVGGRGGEGIVLVKQGNTWSDPAFYNFGGVSAGLQAGVEGGSMAFILNNDKAVKSFMQDNNFALNADAGLTIVNWSAKAQATATEGDVIAWSDTRGLFGDVSASLTDVKFDKDESMAFYGKNVTVNDILTGKTKATQQQVASLKKALPSGAGAMSGGSQSGGSQPMPESKDNQ